MKDPTCKAQKRMGAEHKKPMMGKDPKAKGDGLKAAMRDQGKGKSKVAPMAGAKKKER
jgi:hypothetical protein